MRRNRISGCAAADGWTIGRDADPQSTASAALFKRGRKSRIHFSGHLTSVGPGTPRLS